MKFEELTKKQLEEAEKCKTDEERKAFIRKMKIQLPDDVLNRTVGGNDSDDGYVCNHCGQRFDGWYDLASHVLYDHFVCNK